MTPSWMKVKKICFLCASKYGDDYGEIEYAYTEGKNKKIVRQKICGVCVERLDKSQMNGEIHELR